MTTEIVAYSATEAAIADLSARYAKVVFDVTKPDGMKDAKSAYKDINTHSITLEAARVNEKAESLAYGRRVDSEAKRIADQLDALRLPIKAQIETETKRAEREAVAAAQAELDRLVAEQAALKAAEEKRMAEQRAEIARQQAEIEKAARESRAKIEAEERAARLQREEADRAARLAREAEEAKAATERRAENERIAQAAARVAADLRTLEDAQRKERESVEAKVKAERDAKEAEERKARDAEEVKQREIKRQANELLDGTDMLKTWFTRFGRRAEFATVAAAILKHLEDTPL